MNLTALEKRIIRAVAEGLEPVERPYRAAAARAGVSENELISVLRDLKRRGILRRICAILSAAAAGKPGAALVAWRVRPENLDEAGRALAARKTVSHCIARKTRPQWPYNLYTMMHGAGPQAVEAEAAAAARELDIEDYVVMETVAELKKTPPVYDFARTGREGA